MFSDCLICLMDFGFFGHLMDQNRSDHTMMCLVGLDNKKLKYDPIYHSKTAKIQSKRLKMGVVCSSHHQSLIKIVQ